VDVELIGCDGWICIKATYHGREILTQAETLDDVMPMVLDAFHTLGIDVTAASLDSHAA
jgi:hypothetical protein